jgi:chromosome segregation ATPase
MLGQPGALALLLGIVLVAAVLLLRLRGQGGAALERELAQVATVRAEHDALVIEVATLDDEAQRARKDRASARAALEPARAELEALRARVNEAEHELEELEVELGRIRSLRQEETASLARKQALRAEAEAAVRAAQAALVDSPDARSLAAARSSVGADVLEAGGTTRSEVEGLLDLGAVEAPIG